MVKIKYAQLLLIENSDRCEIIQCKHKKILIIYLLKIVINITSLILNFLLII